MKSLIGTCLVFLSIIGFLMGFRLIWERNNPQRLSLFPWSVTSLSKTSNTSIVIPQLSLRLPVVAGFISNGQWTTTGEGVSHLSSSAQLGKKGNSVLYGHNWPNLLGKLPSIKPGDKVMIETPTKTLVYTVYYTAEVKPSDTSILAKTTDERITLYTCSGFFDEKRFVVTAILDQKPLLGG